MDKRRRPFFAVDTYCAFSDTHRVLHESFGASGPLAWMYLLAAAKRAPEQGYLTFVSEEGFWAELGSQPVDRLPLDAFLTLLGRIKQCSRTPLGQGVTRLRVTNWEKWQQSPRYQAERERKRAYRERLREQDTADNSADDAADDRGDIGVRKGEERKGTYVPPLPVVDRGADTEAPPSETGASSANGSDPGKTTIAAGATGTRSVKPQGLECPHCHVIKAGPLSLEEHIANVHFDDEAA